MLASPTSQSDVAPQIRKSVHGVVSHILQLHIELLSELHRVIPNKSPAHVDPQPDAPAARFKHTRWHSVDDTSGCTAGVSFTHRLRHSIDLIRPCYQQPLSVMADTKVVAALATVFLTFVRIGLCLELSAELKLTQTTYRPVAFLSTKRMPRISTYLKKTPN